MRQTGIELLAADLGTTPERLGLYIVVAVLGMAGMLAWACWKLSCTPAPESFPSDPRPSPKPQAPSPKPGKKAA